MRRRPCWSSGPEDALLAGARAPTSECHPDCRLYWEFYENGSAQAVRFGSWKVVRKPMITGPVELYDLATDPGEGEDVAAANPAIVERAKDFMARAHTKDPRGVAR